MAGASKRALGFNTLDYQVKELTPQWFVPIYTVFVIRYT